MAFATFELHPASARGHDVKEDQPFGARSQQSRDLTRRRFVCPTLGELGPKEDRTVETQLIERGLKRLGCARFRRRMDVDHFIRRVHPLDDSCVTCRPTNASRSGRPTLRPKFSIVEVARGAQRRSGLGIGIRPRSHRLVSRSECRGSTSRSAESFEREPRDRNVLHVEAPDQVLEVDERHVVRGAPSRCPAGGRRAAGAAGAAGCARARRASACARSSGIVEQRSVRRAAVLRGAVAPRK